MLVFISWIFFARISIAVPLLTLPLWLITIFASKRYNNGIRELVNKSNDNLGKKIYMVSREKIFRDCFSEIKTGIEFERFISDLLNEIGYNVHNTKASGDYGVDTIELKDNVKYGYQAKFYSTPVGVRAVQEVSSGIVYYKLDQALVITNNTCTNAAYKLAPKTGVKLLEGKDIDFMLLLLRNKKIYKGLK